MHCVDRSWGDSGKGSRSGDEGAEDVELEARRSQSELPKASIDTCNVEDHRLRGTPGSEGEAEQCHPPQEPGNVRQGSTSSATELEVQVIVIYETFDYKFGFHFGKYRF